MITLENIEKSYDLGETKVTALEQVSMKIEEGEYVAIMGPSGSGKSTLMNILGILDSPTEGRYLLEGHDITSLPDKEQARIRNRHFGFVFQSFNLFPELSAMENVMLPMNYAGLPFPKRRARASELLDWIGLKHRMSHLPTMMSGGEQQRVAIARALANEPNLLLADEPTGNLPSEKGEEILQALEDLNKQGVTIVMVTHNDDQAGRANRVIRIHDGRVLGVAA
ncbi:MAG: ABC transporter ATP-binding protein [Spirochaetales bacterium]|jgi:putative ABC transport system ATP-binding protein|nr:ABC transporter ATP-binding protein [Spirochaetales bacterium]